MTEEGEIIVADSYNHAIRTLVPSRPGEPQAPWNKVYYNQGIIIAKAGGLRGRGHPMDARFCDGDAETALFNSPCGLCLSSNGSLFVTEFSGHRIRQLLDPRAQRMAFHRYEEHQGRIRSLTMQLEKHTSSRDFQTSRILDAVNSSRRFVSQAYKSVRTSIFTEEVMASLEAASDSKDAELQTWQVCYVIVIWYRGVGFI